MRSGKEILETDKIYNMDCLTGLNMLEDENIDLVITDPPYKLNKTTGSITSSSKSEKWQGNLKAGDKNASIINDIKFSEWLPEVYRVLKGYILKKCMVAFFLGQQFLILSIINRLDVLLMLEVMNKELFWIL